MKACLTDGQLSSILHHTLPESQWHVCCVQTGALVNVYARSDITTLCKGNSYNR